MNKSIITIVYILIALCTVAQPNSALATYKEYINTDRPLVVESVLDVDINKNTSIYARNYADAIIWEEKASPKGIEDDNPIDENIRAGKYDYIEINAKEKTMTLIEDFTKSYLKIIDIFPSQQWKILDELKEINGIQCQKATVHYRGRDYVAWYATEIPIRFGPWKFYGLPGLIVEVSDSKKELNISLQTLTYDSAERTILPATVHKEVTIKEYDKMLYSFYKNIFSEYEKQPGVTSNFFGVRDIELEYEWEKK